MSDQPYRIFGAEASPYSIKVRAYFRYKRIPHTWIPRTMANQEEFSRHAKLPLIPLVIAPDGGSLQDSTPIIEQMEREFPEPSVHPVDPTLAFLSALIEEYGDEWGNKPMFHYRWFYEADQQATGVRLARAMMPDLPDDALPAAKQSIIERMVPRLRFVGSSAETKDQIEGSFLRQLAILEAHLTSRPFLFGGRPAFADFGLAPQLWELSSDPTPGAIMRARAPRVTAWADAMLDPRASGDFETWEALAPTLTPLLRDEVGATFLPWSTANAGALQQDAKEFTVELGGKPFSQQTQKYHARSLAALRARYATVADKRPLDPILESTGCLRWLA
jgi:glutathione S-transferase